MTLNEIPKIIWQTHEWDYDDLPQNFLAASTTWKNLNPDWEYRYLNAAERELYVRNNDYLLYKIYKLHDKVSQADLWRYIAIYKEGGVYADMDSVCTVPLTYMLETKQNNAEVVVMSVATDEVLNNSHFAAVKNSQTIKKVLENVVSHYKKTNDWIDLIMIYDTIEEFWEEFKRRLRLHPGIFEEVIASENPALISRSFDVIHSDLLKISFDQDYEVNYNGRLISYFQLAKKFGWKTHITS